MMQIQELPALLVPLTMMLTTQPGFSSHPHHPQQPGFSIHPQQPQDFASALLQAAHWLNPSSPCGALSAAFVTHYTYRALVYPCRLRAPKGLPCWCGAWPLPSVSGTASYRCVVSLTSLQCIVS
jgi:hypothetical protein